MRREKRWRYYCDFCKKSGASGGHMKRHERGCTLNPERVCGMCRLAGEEQRPMVELLQLAAKGGLKALQDATENCPACILAAIRQTPVLRGDAHGDELAEFSYKNASEAWWQIHNDSRNGCE